MKLNLKNIILLGALLTSQLVRSEEIPFNCDYSAYLFQRNDVYAIDLASGSSYLVAVDVITTGYINGAGYNPADGFIWGSITNPKHTLIRIGKDFTPQFFEVPELPEANRYIGDVRDDGMYFAKAGGVEVHKVDLTIDTTGQVNYVESMNLSQDINIHDWAFNAVDGQLYTVEKNTNILYKVNPDNGEVTNLGVVPILSGLSYTYGAVYFDSEGRFYVSANQTGTVYIIYSVQDIDPNGSMQSNLFAYGPSSSSNDGARCPTAPVPQEDCLNGIDDDGDGLIDCDDPSCSGVASCPVLTPTSSGNTGGLESNNRLSEKVNLRNFKRARDGKKFNRLKAASFKGISVLKSANNGVPHIGSMLPTESPIPGLEGVHSTPRDLIDITNASDMYSIDYLDSDKNTAAVLMAIKTNAGVYEHTKYICDRMSGAEILSVGTLNVGEESFEEGEGVQQFIKTEIRNSDGSKEYVVSFAARLESGEFVIESHWNLSEFTADADYYNYQIWANNVDDLLLFTNKILEIINETNTIKSYSISSPPPVYVRKGSYNNGVLNLEVINSLYNVEGVDYTLEGGFRSTETNPQYAQYQSVSLNEYSNNVRLETGQMFDFGFRLSNSKEITPDDVFISDGAYGVDTNNGSTSIHNYNVSQNDNLYDGEGYRVERNVELEIGTSTYGVLYRSLSPRFEPLDFSNYNTLSFTASGNGELIVSLFKNSIQEWDQQFKTRIMLTDSEKRYDLSLDDFVGGKASFERNDLNVLMLILAASEQGVEEARNLSVSDIEFRNLATNIGESLSDNSSVTVFPDGSIQFNSPKEGNYKLDIHTVSGALVGTYSGNLVKGVNKVQVNRGGNVKGIYVYKLNTSVGIQHNSKMVFTD